ncbi:hypothetical protein JAO85_14005 [Comamonas sp. NyZ500]|uniref:hypothetical protein n=1 Tax=Comamonas sp. NyZ500 TaxID=2795732 RepID=UPI00192AE3E5|nr:hypothetical protein [Comamonas sp. NyZ500]MBL5978399.1 hypothetical protein [Comamonas sp. NyZ500]
MQDKTPLAHYSGVLSEAVHESAAVTGETTRPIAPEFNLKTSAGGRGYVSWYFSNIMQRHDFGNYITKTLAADFACALASWLRDGKPRVESHAAPAAVAVPDGWTPTVENVNALPDPLRAYIHALETNADPSGMVRDNTILREQLAGLQIMFRKSQDALAATPAATESREELAHRLIGEVKTADAIATAICQRVAELGDRSSPEDWPEAMLVTGDELHLIAREAVIEAQETSAAAAPVVLPEPDGVANLPYFSYDSDSGVEFHETEAEAIKACESALGYYREESPDGWPDEVESLKWGLVLGRSVQCDVQPIEDHPDFTETCDYQLKPYALLATATGLPAQAVADEVHCVCGASWLRHGVNDYEMTDTPRKAQASGDANG